MLNQPYTIFQVIEINQSKSQLHIDEPEVPQDEFTQFVLCVKNLNKPTLKQIDEQRIEIVYWLSEYFGRYIPTEFFLPIVDIDFSASAFHMFLPRLDFNKLTASLEDVYEFLKKIAPMIEVSDETINKWRENQTELRHHQQRYQTMPTESRLER